MKTIFYELNEVPRKLFDFYAAGQPRSNLATLKRYGNLYLTIAADIGHLSPWVTWPSLHRGVNNSQHGISTLGQDLTLINEEFPPVWQLLSSRGVSVGMFGSLQSYPLPKDLENYKFYVPDTFAAGPECFPEKLSEFQKFNLSMVRMNGRNVSSGIAITDAIRFLQHSPFLGLRGKTYLDLGKQLIQEQINKDRLTRRRTSQIQIAFDFFFKQLLENRPDMSFFFTNHVASSMHRYWPTIFPKDYSQGKFEAGWMEQWSKEIPFTIRVADNQIGRLMNFVDDNHNYRLVILSSMGQAAVEKTEVVYREAIIADVSRLMTYLGFSRDEWEPRLGMAPVVAIQLREGANSAKMERLNDIKLSGTNINCVPIGRKGFRLQTRCINVKNIEAVDSKTGPVDPASLGVVNIDLQDAAGSYAYHIPQGILIEYSRAHRGAIGDQNWREISALDVAPSLLRNFGITPPGTMSGEQRLFGGS